MSAFLSARGMAGSGLGAVTLSVASARGAVGSENVAATLSAASAHGVVGLAWRLVFVVESQIDSCWSQRQLSFYVAGLGQG